jgi:hypothetical protein
MMSKPSNDEEEDDEEGGRTDEPYLPPVSMIEPTGSFEKSREKLTAASASKRPAKKKPKDKPKRYERKGSGARRVSRFVSPARRTGSNLRLSSPCSVGR